MRKLTKLISVALCGAMLLTGCGKSGDGKAGNDSGAFSQNESEYTFSEIKESGELVVLFLTCDAYRDGIPAKDSVPRVIYILDDGKVYGDIVEDTTFGEYSKMTDEEIKQYVMENGIKSEYSYVNNEDYQIAVYTDSTGNNISYESLLVPHGSYYDEYLMYIYDDVTAEATVYDSTYVGMNWNNVAWEGRQGFLWYRSNDGFSIEKDTTDTEGILVDPKEAYVDDYFDR